MCNNYQLISYFGGLCVSDQTGLSRGLRIHFFFINNHVNIAIMYIVCGSKINEHSDSDSDSAVIKRQNLRNLCPGSVRAA